jgi:hypothetical protein
MGKSRTNAAGATSLCGEQKKKKGKRRKNISALEIHSEVRGGKVELLDGTDR